MARARLAVPALAVLLLGLASPTATAAPGPEPATAMYYIGGEATISYYTPATSAPLVETGEEYITGQFELRREPTSPYFGSTYYTVLDAQLMAVPSGRTFSLTGSDNSFVCWSTNGYCTPDVQLADSAGGTVALVSTGIAPFGPSPSDPATYPASYDWTDSRNIYTGGGFGLYQQTVTWDEDYEEWNTSYEIFAAIRGHATRDSAPPSVSVSPSIGGVYELGQVVPVQYSCSDPAGVNACLGSVESGQGIDTSTPGDHAFVVTTSDNWGNSTDYSFPYTVAAPEPELPPGALDEAVSGGETASTGSDATADVPVQTSITVPAGVAGDLSVTPVAPGAAPTGYYLFGKQLVIEGPAATADNPYTMSFTVDSSVLNGLAPSDVQVFRNGIVVTGCTSPTAAVPDPCVVSRGFAPGGSGDALVTVRTSHFSDWSLGRLDYDLGPVLAPVDPLPTVNSVTAGSTVPLKFSLGGDRGLDVLAGSPRVSSASCGIATADPVEETVAASRSGLTYDDGVYQYNWKSAKSQTGCKLVTLTFRDGSTLQAKFELR